MDDKFDLIERYLTDDMSVEEQVRFEEMLRSDHYLMSEFLFRRKINEAISEKDVMTLREKLDDIVDWVPERNIQFRSKLVLSSVAAIIILAMVVSGTYFFPASRLKTNQLFESYYSTYPSFADFRSSSENSPADNLLFMAFDLYEKGSFDSSFDYFQKIFADDSSNKMALFYMASCRLESNNIKESIGYFEQLIKDNNHIFWEQSHWYLAMAYFKNSDLTRTGNLLNKIIKENMNKKTEAEELHALLNN